MDFATAVAVKFLAEWTGGKEVIWDAYFGKLGSFHNTVRNYLANRSNAELGEIVGVGKHPAQTLPRRHLDRTYSTTHATYQGILRVMAADVLIDRMAEILRNRGETSHIVREEEAVGN